MANEITPHLTAEEYMDKGEYENELKQVIGDTKVTLSTMLHEFVWLEGSTQIDYSYGEFGGPHMDTHPLNSRVAIVVEGR